jgi:DNA-binding beta-propeller fold protein YncE
VITGATQTINVLTDPTGKIIYVLDQNVTSSSSPGQVFAFNLDPATGLIGSQIGTAEPTGATPLGMAIDPSGALTIAAPATVPTDLIPQFVVFYTAASGQ